MKNTKRTLPAIVIRRLDDNSAVHHIEVSNPTERKLDKLERGLLIKTDLERFWLDLSEFETETPSDHSAAAPDHLDGFEPWGPSDA